MHRCFGAKTARTSIMAFRSDGVNCLTMKPTFQLQCRVLSHQIESRGAYSHHLHEIHWRSLDLPAWSMLVWNSWFREVWILVARRPESGSWDWSFRLLQRLFCDISTVERFLPQIGPVWFRVRGFVCIQGKPKMIRFFNSLRDQLIHHFQSAGDNTCLDNLTHRSARWFDCFKNTEKCF